MSEEKKKTVLPVEEKTQKQDAKAEEVKEAEVTVSLPFDLTKKQIKKAEAFGIPIKQLLQWAGSVEYRFQILAKNLETAPQEVVRLLKADMAKARQQIVERGNEGTQSGRGRGDLASLGQILRETGVVGGGGGMDEEMSGLMKDMFRLNMDRMRQDMTNSMTRAKSDADLSDALKSALAKEFAKKTAGKLME